MGAAGTQLFLRFVERQRARLLQMRERIEDMIRQYSRPTIGFRRYLYMNKLVDAIDAVHFHAQQQLLL